MGGPEDASRRLDDLLALAAGGFGPLREAIGELGEDAGELLLAAVLRVSSLEAAARFGAAVADERDPDEGRADPDEELPVEDPFVDPAVPYAAMLDAARQLRLALLDQPDLPAVVNATRALSADENALIVLELAFESWYERTREGGAGAEREDRDR